MQNLHIYIARYIGNNMDLVWFIEEMIFIGISLGILKINALVNEHIKNNKILMRLLSVGIVIGITIYLLFIARSMGTYFMFTFVSTIIVLMTIRIAHLFELNELDYAVLYMLLFQYKNLEIFLSARESFTLLVYGLIIFSIAATKKNQFWGNVFNIWLAISVCMIAYILFDMIYEEILYKVYCYVRMRFAIGNVTKLTFFGVIMLISIGINGYLIAIIKRALEPISIKLQELGKSYKKAEKQFLGFALVSVLVLYGTQMIVDKPENWGFSSSLRDLLNWSIVLVIMALHAYIIYMMVQLAYTRKVLEDERFQKQSLLLYQNDLDKNISQMTKINHDIKNIFFTVGSFVERSQDEEMKQYFNEKIMPFAVEEMKKSSLYQKLQAISDEQLRAFLYYKIQQGLVCQIDMELEIELKGQGEYPISFIDLIRILGILIDNAIEECTYISDGKIQVKIMENGEIRSYRIANTIRETQMQKVDFIGTSTKGLGRGNGLIIVKELISKYENVILNTYIKEENFIQQLEIYSKS